MLRRLYLPITIGYISFSYLIFLIFNNQIIKALGREDGFFEWFGAICFLIASVIFFLLFKGSQKGNDFIFFKTKKNLFFILLALAFFFAFGEEINWGQRILNIETPEALKTINIQDDFNIHNINIFHKRDASGQKKPLLGQLSNFNFLFNVFCLLYCGLIPILCKFNKAFLRLSKRINLPIVPIWLGIIFITVVIASEVIEWSIASELRRTVFEMKECNLAFLFMMSSFCMLSDPDRAK